MREDAPALRFAFAARVRVGAPEELGETPHGRRRTIPILGGTVEGPRLAGTIRPGGADFQLIRRDGVAEIEARYTIEAADATLVGVVNRGLRHGPPETMARLARGEAVDPASYFFRTFMRFETGAPELAVLNTTMALATAVRRARRVELRCFKLL